MDAAAVEGSEAAVQEAIEEGAIAIPPDLMLAAAPLPGAASGAPTYHLRPQIAIHRRTPQLGTDEVVEAVDVLPTRATTALKDPVDRFLTTLERTARVAAIERAAFDVSTASLLDDRELIDAEEFEPGEEYPHRGSYDDLRVRAGVGRDDYRQVPTDGSAYAFWNVDRETGTLLGVIDDGTGGGRKRQRLQEALDGLSQLMSFYNLMITGMAAGGMVSGLGAFSLGIVAMYGQQLARMYAAVVLVLITMDAAELEVQARRAIAAMACGVAVQITLGSFDVFGDNEGLIGDLLGVGNDTVGAMGGSTPISCSIPL